MIRFTVVVGIVLSFLLTASPRPVFADNSYAVDPYNDDCPPNTKKWWCRYDQEGYLAASWVADDDHLTGAMVGYGTRGFFEEMVRWKTFQGAYQEHDHENVWTLRRDWALAIFARRWGGFGPVMAFGLEYRDGDLHPGFGGYFGLGGHLTLWTQQHWQFAVVVEHDFGISSESRNAVATMVVYAHPKLGFKPY